MPFEESSDPGPGPADGHGVPPGRAPAGDGSTAPPEAGGAATEPPVFGPQRPWVSHSWRVGEAHRARRRGRPRAGSERAEQEYHAWARQVLEEIPAGWTAAERAAHRNVRALRDLSAQLPGAELAVKAAAIDGERVGAEVLREKLRANQRLMNWLAADQADIIAAMDQRQSNAAAPYLDEEVAAALSITSYAAARLSDRAQALQACPELRQALRAGRIDARRTDVFIEGTQTLTGAQARAVHRALLPVAEVITPAQLRKRVATAVAADPEAARERHEQAAATRTVSLTPAADGMAWLNVFLPAPEAMAAFTAIDALAGRKRADDDRPVGARRADAFGQILTETLNRGRTPGGCALGTRQGMRPRLILTMGVGTWNGTNDTPAYLDGYGPIDAGTAREIAQGCTDPRLAYTHQDTGALIGLDRRAPGPEPRPGTATAARTVAASPGWTTGTADEDPATGQHPGPGALALIAAVRAAGAGQDPVTHLEHALGLLATNGYAPSARLQEFILTRDRTCRFPTCEQPATRCQIDHIDPFTQDLPAWAQTVQTNLHLLCTRHHQMKTSGAWTLTRGAAGTTYWTSPMGTRVERPPEVVDAELLAALLQRAMTHSRPESDDREDLAGPLPLDPGTSEASNPSNLADSGLSLEQIARRLIPDHDPANQPPAREPSQRHGEPDHRHPAHTPTANPAPARPGDRPRTGHRPGRARRATKRGTRAPADPEHPPF